MKRLTTTFLLAVLLGLLWSAAPAQAIDATLTWTDNSTNEDQFIIERKTNAAGTYVQIGTVGANVGTYVDTSVPTPVPAGTVYFYRVKARNAAGDSAFSNEAGFPKPGPPTNLQAQ